MSLAGLFGLWGKESPGPLILAVAVGLAITGLAIYSAVYKVPAPLNTVTRWFVGWAAVGVMITVGLIATGRFRLSAQGAGAIGPDVPAEEMVRPEF